MAGRQAKVLTPVMQKRLLRHIDRSSDPDRNRVIVMLALKAGLRACEIARLEWTMVLDAKGRVGQSIEIYDRIAKKRGGRRIPLHPELRAALIRYHRSSEGPGPIIQSARGGALRPNSIVNWFVDLFAELGLEGCSSHSGRRTFITAAARTVSKSGGSLRDIQLLAGHRSIETTQHYIDGDSAAQRKLIALI
ncbi:MAG: site-specific integrase [Beijerinckiaceae bacterium]|jgi:integrase/recombinase XerD